MREAPRSFEATAAQVDPRFGDQPRTKNVLVWPAGQKLTTLLDAVAIRPGSAEFVAPSPLSDHGANNRVWREGSTVVTLDGAVKTSKYHGPKLERVNPVEPPAATAFVENLVPGLFPNRTEP